VMRRTHLDFHPRLNASPASGTQAGIFDRGPLYL
jgi:hypothetical protein